MMLRTRPARPRRDAAAVVELALLLPFLLVVIIGIWEVGRLIQVQQALNNAAREGTRLAAQGQIISQVGAPTQIAVSTGTPSALNDIQKNHPNDWAALIYFSNIGSYATPRVPMGRSYFQMKNALFFPFSLLNKLSDQTAEIRPYDSSFNSVVSGDVPNADGGTTPGMGFMGAYNQFSSASGFNGRRGAAKVVIFETDGVPNTVANGSLVNGGASNSYYRGIAPGSYLGNNNATVTSGALALVDQIVAQDSASPPGYSTAKDLARVHAIAFGDLFQSGSTLETQALDFLLKVQQHGHTSPQSATSVENYKIIVGDYNTRINLLREALEHIMQSGIQVALIK